MKSLSSILRRHPRILVSAEWLAIVLLIVFMGSKVLMRAWTHLNTDFPDYYLTARLVHEKVDTTRIYEWTWLQRQKDHREIDQPLVGLAPITPISTLVTYPLTGFAPLFAKRIWIVLNVALLAAVLWLLHAMTALAWRHLVLITALSYPVLRNLFYGQYYILLLFLIAAACWLYLREKKLLSGIVLSLAIALKIFPVVYLFYFLRKRQWRAAGGCLSGLVALASVSWVVFGWQLNRTYLQQGLPAALRGEMLDPYILTLSSLSALLHHLLIYEPQWNPHPIMHASALFAVLHPLIQMLVLAPVFLLIHPEEITGRGVRLEWASILLAALAISTSPASYQFTLLLLPVCFLLELFAQQSECKAITILLALYLAVGFPSWPVGQGAGWHAFLGVPRLYAMVLFSVLSTVLLLRRPTGEVPQRDAARLPWAIGFAVFMVAGVAAGLHHQRNLYRDYAWRLPLPKSVMMARSIASAEGRVHGVAMFPTGYRAIVLDGQAAAQSLSSSAPDQLSLAAAGTQLWVEETGTHSNLVSGATFIADAEMPALSQDGHALFYLREVSGRSRVWRHELSASAPDHLLLQPDWNVLEMAAAPDGSLIVSAMKGTSPAALFRLDALGEVTQVLPGEARYPAISPDGNWLAYSRMQNGYWNLWLRNLHSGSERRFTEAECNFMDPGWEPDSKALLYVSDCGRALGWTALSRRPIAP